MLVLIEQEAMALAAAGSHPNIVRYYSSWTEQQGNGQLFYILMEKCDVSLGTKQSLGARSFKEAELVEILRQVQRRTMHAMKWLAGLLQNMAQTTTASQSLEAPWVSIKQQAPGNLLHLRHLFDSADNVLGCGGQMAEALQHLHARGIVHMDVKPDNIYTTEQGTFKLGDFGLATCRSCRPDVALEEGDSRWDTPSHPPQALYTASPSSIASMPRP